MKKIIVFILITLLYSSTFATIVKPITCNKFAFFANIKQQLKHLNDGFKENDSSCKIVLTKSIFPRKKNHSIQFEPGVQAFIYENNQLKFICLPGWFCKAW